MILLIARNAAIRLLIKWEKSRDNMDENLECLLLESLMEQ